VSGACLALVNLYKVDQCTWPRGVVLGPELISWASTQRGVLT